MSQSQPPAGRLAMARGYVFRRCQPALFEVLYEAGLDKASHPEIEQAERPSPTPSWPASVPFRPRRDPAWLGRRRAFAGSDSGAALADDLASALEATALGHVMLFLDGGAARTGTLSSSRPTGRPGDSRADREPSPAGPPRAP